MGPQASEELNRPDPSPPARRGLRVTVLVILGLLSFAALFSLTRITFDFNPQLVYESDTAVAFRDINSKAPTHVLVIPRKHISTINDIEKDDELIIGSLYTAAREIAALEGVAEEGYRTVMNCNESSGQSVFHIHLHVMGGRSMGWPPWPSG